MLGHRRNHVVAFKPYESTTNLQYNHNITSKCNTSGCLGFTVNMNMPGNGNIAAQLFMHVVF